MVLTQPLFLAEAQDRARQMAERYPHMTRVTVTVDGVIYTFAVRPAGGVEVLSARAFAEAAA